MRFNREAISGLSLDNQWPVEVSKSQMCISFSFVNGNETKSCNHLLTLEKLIQVILQTCVLSETLSTLRTVFLLAPDK